jgi:hypothetical protein
MTATESVVIIRFPQPSQAYQALRELRELNESQATSWLSAQGAPHHDWLSLAGDPGKTAGSAPCR